MEETKIGETVARSHTPPSKLFAHLELSPFPLELLPSDIHVPQNRSFVLIKRMRERVTPGIGNA